MDLFSLKSPAPTSPAGTGGAPGGASGSGAPGGNGAAVAPRMLAAFTTVAELQLLLRARAEELQISRGDLDLLAGLTPGYASKVLAPSRIKALGPISLPALLGALGLKLCLMEDAEQRARMSLRFTPRNPNYANHTGVVNVILSKRHMRIIGKRGGANSRLYMTREEASRLAMKAGRNSRKRVSAAERTRLARKAGIAGALARWRDIKAAVRPNGNGRGPIRPPNGNGAARTKSHPSNVLEKGCGLSTTGRARDGGPSSVRN
jgi:hypothetical protein